MSGYLLVWNPKRWSWDDLGNKIATIERQGYCSDRWSCGKTRSMAIGDRVFLVRLGLDPKGIMGSGVVTSQPFTDAHWSGDDEDAVYVEVEFDHLIDPKTDKILSLERLVAEMPQQHWTPQASGISITDKMVDDLEAIWFETIAASPAQRRSFAIEPVAELKEGTAREVRQTRYERNPHARAACIAHFGTSCMVCDFNFERYYGDLGKDFIHVHHLAPIAEKQGPYTIDPLRDLRPVCPNCHAMIHQKKLPFSIEEIKVRLKK